MGFQPFSHLIPVVGSEVRVPFTLPDANIPSRRSVMKIYNQGANDVRVGFGNGPNAPTDDLQLVLLPPATTGAIIDFQENAPEGDIYITGTGAATTVLVVFG